ncbi:MAG: putative alpha/beta-fold hydrolase [Desulforhopalus sp.]|jgi:predicted alpha/beta-fold hydrolase
MTRSFKPPTIIRNGHVQTTLTSLRPRKYLAGHRATALKEVEQNIILDCGNGVRLLGTFSEGPNQSKGLVTLIHGWEGSSESSYILSAGTALFEDGFSVFRLNLRDHGGSHHLNRKPFNSSRLDEVCHAIKEINRIFPHERSFLAGFSLGGNFAIRIGAQSANNSSQLTKIVAISPLVNPLTTTENMEDNHKIYHHYFIKKWKKSLRKKMACFPEMDDPSVLLQLGTLREMHDYFVPRHTESKTTADYFDTYRLQPQILQSLSIPTHIISSMDDPITRISELNDIDRVNNPNLKIHRVPYGGHCGFIQDYRLTSWVDTQLVTLFANS